MNKSLLLALSLLIPACSGSSTPVEPEPACDACDYIDPWKPGPYPVGVRSELWIDHNRDALAWRGCGASTCPRPLPVSIWYPATDDSRDLPQATFKAFFTVTEDELQAVIDDLVEELNADPIEINIPDKSFQSRENAKLREGEWPVILFSHGAGGVRFQNLFQVEYLASHGYIVVSADHEGDATITEIEGELVTVSIDNFIASGLNRPRDMQFLIDELERLQHDPEHFLNGSLYLDPGVGQTGHSFGSFTGITVANIDPRIGAIVPMAAPGISGFGNTVPTLFMVATEDDTIDAELNEVIRWEYDIAQTPKMLLELLDAGHYTFSNMCDLFPAFGDGCGVGERITNGEPITYLDPELAFEVINGYTAAWFGLYIKGDERYRGDLFREAPVDGVRQQVLGPVE